jgi:MOB kinase activator 1
MNAGPGCLYLWRDGGASADTPPAKLCARDYIMALLGSISARVRGAGAEELSAGEVGDFFRRLFRIYAHFFHGHYDAFSAAGAAHVLRESFRHFAQFTRTHGLLPRPEAAPLAALIAALLDRPANDTLALRGCASAPAWLCTGAGAGD